MDASTADTSDVLARQRLQLSRSRDLGRGVLKNGIQWRNHHPDPIDLIRNCPRQKRYSSNNSELEGTTYLLTGIKDLVLALGVHRGDSGSLVRLEGFNLLLSLFHLLLRRLTVD